MKAMISGALTLPSLSDLFLGLAMGPDFPRPLLGGMCDFGLRSPGAPARLRRQPHRLRKLIHGLCCIAMSFGKPRSTFAIPKAIGPHSAQLLFESLRNHDLRT